MRKRPVKGDKARPNKAANGAQYTYDRHKGGAFRKPLTDAHYMDMLRLITRGSMDSLSQGLMFSVVRVACPCCGHKAGGKLRLNDSGRRRLRRARTKARERRAGWPAE